jgi:hypothetical protein
MSFIQVDNGGNRGGGGAIYGTSGNEYLQFPTNTSHPIIPNSNEYTIFRKYLSVHSEDRNVIKEPNSNKFSIIMPQYLENVAAVRLTDWSFPANYNVFSFENSNLGLTFQISNPYNPGAVGLPDPLQNAIFIALNAFIGHNFTITIEPGFYNPSQMTNELTNKMNEAVTVYLIEYFGANGLSTQIDALNTLGGYSEFVVVYNYVGQKIYFGNRSSTFILTTSNEIKTDYLGKSIKCYVRNQEPDFSNWGLGYNLGLSRCDTSSIDPSNNYVRFYYGNVFPGDNGYWLTPDLTGAFVSYIECPYKINFMGPSYMYMELDVDGDNTMNCIDETQPFNLSDYTVHTNNTNGIVNGSFAKIPITTTPIAQWFDREQVPYKLMTPPMERIRKLSFMIRYHNGQEVDFGQFPFSFTIEFTQLLARQTRPKLINNNQN